MPAFDIGAELDPVTVESVGHGFDGYPNVFLGRVVLDDLQAAQLRKLGGASGRCRSAGPSRLSFSVRLSGLTT